MNFRAEVYAKARNTRKGTKLRRRAEDWSFFGGRQVDFVQMETIAIFCTRMPRDAVRLCGKKWKTQENLTQNKYPLQDQKWRNGLTWKTKTVWKPVLRLELKKFLVCGWQDEKDRHVIIGIIPCVVVTGLGNWCICGIRCLFSTCWREVTSARGREKKVLKEQLLLWEKKQRSKVVFPKTQIQWVLFYGKMKNWDWTLRRDTPEVLRMHLVRN